jgi:hypothetical protein
MLNRIFSPGPKARIGTRIIEILVGLRASSTGKAQSEGQSCLPPL